MSGFLSVLVAMLLVVGVFYVIMQPRWATLLIVVMFPLEQLVQSYLPFLIENKQLFNYVVGGIAVLSVVRRVGSGAPIRHAFNPLIVCLAALTILAWASLAWAPDTESAQKYLGDGLPYNVLMIVFLPLLLNDLEDFKSIAFGLLLVGGLIIGLIFINPSTQFSGSRIGLDIGAVAGSDRSNPLALGSIGGMVALAAALLRFDRKSLPITIFRIGAFAIGLGLAIASGSRGQVFGTIIVAVMFYPMAQQIADTKRFMVTVGSLVFFGFLMYIAFSIFIGDHNRARWDIGGAITSSEGRLFMVLTLLEAWMADPAAWFFGLGANAFTSVSGFGFSYAHNVPAEVLGELGLVGFLLLTIGTLYTLGCARLIWRLYRDDPVRRSVMTLLLALASFEVLMMLKQGSFIAQGARIMLFWIIIATVGTRERSLAAEAGLLDADEYDDEEAWAEGYDGYEGYDEGYGDEEPVYGPA
jgi:hypothetical protein